MEKYQHTLIRCYPTNLLLILKGNSMLNIPDVAALGLWEMVIPSDWHKYWFPQPMMKLSSLSKILLKPSMQTSCPQVKTQRKLEKSVKGSTKSPQNMQNPSGWKAY